MDQRRLTIDDMCKYLNVTNEMVYKRIEHRAMPVHRVSRRWMFKHDKEVDILFEIVSLRLSCFLSGGRYLV